MNNEQIANKIEALKNEANTILLDQENNPSKYNNYFVYAEANEKIESIGNEILNLQYEIIQNEMIQNMPNTVQNAIKKVQIIIPTFKGLDYEIVNQNVLRNKNTLADYDCNKLVMRLQNDSTVETIVHEIGHHIHNLINNMESLRIPKTTEYSRTNCMESFAEAFMITVLRPNSHPKATTRILKVLKENGFTTIE